jgi:hypothetical protein
MRRRNFLSMLGGAAAWPLAARAQQRERMRRIGMLVPGAADDPTNQVRVANFMHGLQGGRLGHCPRRHALWPRGWPGPSHRLPCPRADMLQRSSRLREELAPEICTGR